MLLDLIEAKAWRVNELVILTFHLAEITKDVIEVLTIDILPLFSNCCHSHVQEIMTSILRKMVDNNLVDFLVRSNSRLKQDYGSKIRERKNSNTKDHSFDVASVLPLVVMLSHQGICILPNGLVVPSYWINSRFDGLG